MTLVGLSFGGGVAVDTALEHPELVSALVVSGTGTSEPEFTDPWMHALFTDIDAPDHLRNSRRLVDTVSGARAATVEGTAHYPQMERPDDYTALAPGLPPRPHLSDAAAAGGQPAAVPARSICGCPIRRLRLRCSCG